MKDKIMIITNNLNKYFFFNHKKNKIIFQNKQELGYHY